MKRQSVLAIVCGILPLTVIHFAYWLNIHGGEALLPIYQCNPYFEGCVSTSRAVRSGPGLIWFKAVMLPVAVLMALTWRSMGAWMAGFGRGMPRVRRWTVWLGVGGAIALVVYVIYLGTEGEVYRWLRRYGVIFFFGFTALAQLVAARFVWGIFHTALPLKAAFYVVVVSLQWAIGVFSAFKRLLFDDPAFIDQLENITEWLMVATMSLGFFLIGLLLRPVRESRTESY